ncbi:MAG: 6-carboxytetrahydropterin synthase [Pseudomonadota bacterium]
MATELTDPQTDRYSLSLAGQMFEITKGVTFEAAHRLPGRGATDPYGRMHGHSFRLDVTVAGKVQADALWVEDLGVITTALEGIAAKLDHQLLNDLPGLSTPTLENIALWVANELRTILPGLSVVTLSRPSLNEVCKLRLG